MITETVDRRDRAFCAYCRQWIGHDRGYLLSHKVGVQRGALVVGDKLCDGSNTKPALNLKTVTFTGTCPSCLHSNRVQFTETYPGSLERYGGVLDSNCQWCGAGRPECLTCGLSHPDDTVLCVGGDGTQEHVVVHRPATAKPVLLTDNHVIVVSDEDPVPA